MCPSLACMEATQHIALGVEKMCWWVEEAGCVPCINAAVLIERLVVLAKRESKGVGVAMSAVVFCKEFVLRTFFFHTCMLPKRLPIVLSVNVRFAPEEFLG